MRPFKCTNTCKMKFCEYCVRGKKIRVKFGTTNYDTHKILKYVHRMYGDQSRLHQWLQAIIFFYLLMICLDMCGCTTCEQMINF